MEIQNHISADNAEQAAMLWMRKNYRGKMNTLKPFQLINHFPNERVVINKGHLTETLARFDRVRDNGCLPASEFYRESYRLYSPRERAEFFAQLPEKDDPENIWIYKPGNSSRGRGIEIMWQFDQLRKEYETWGDRTITDADDQGIMQRYIKNPLLLDGRKSEIRVYWLVANLDPLMVLLYPEATVRLNSLPYKLDDFDNQLVHVTNVYQQKNHPDFDPDVVLKWKFEKLGRYLSEDLGRVGPDFLPDHLIPRIRDILATVSYAMKDELAAKLPTPGHSFAVFGADLIIDDNLNPWLSEVQKGPGLSFSDPVKSEVIPPMLGEAARIAFEMRRNRIRQIPHRDLTSVERYQWVVNDLQPELVEQPGSDYFYNRTDTGMETEVALPA